MAHQKTWSGRVLSISDKPIINVNEARKVLGKEYEQLSDEHLMGTIISLSKIADYFLDNIKVPENHKVSGTIGV